MRRSRLYPRPLTHILVAASPFFRNLLFFRHLCGRNSAYVGKGQQWSLPDVYRERGEGLFSTFDSGIHHAYSLAHVK